MVLDKRNDMAYTDSYVANVVTAQNERGNRMSIEIKNGKIGDVNAIRIFGGNPNIQDEDGNKIPEVKPALAKLFNVDAEMYMVVGLDYLSDVILHLKRLGYVFKLKPMTKYTVIALQYQKP